MGSAAASVAGAARPMSAEAPSDTAYCPVLRPNNANSRCGRAQQACPAGRAHAWAGDLRVQPPQRRSRRRRGRQRLPDEQEIPRPISAPADAARRSLAHLPGTAPQQARHRSRRCSSTRTQPSRPTKVAARTSITT